MPRKSPAYVVIADELRKWIERGDYREGERLPNERSLVDTFGVARMTVRHALDILQLEGLIDRRRGGAGGTFIRGLAPLVELTCLSGIAAQLEKLGFALNTKILSHSPVEAAARVAQGLGVEPGQTVGAVTRIRYVDGTPLMVENIYLPEEVSEGLGKGELSAPLPEILAATPHLTPVRKSDTLTPSVATEVEQNQLAVPRNVPLLRIHTQMFNKDKTPVAYDESVLRSDVVKMQVITEV